MIKQECIGVPDMILLECIGIPDMILLLMKD